MWARNNPFLVHNVLIDIQLVNYVLEYMVRHPFV
jgi:hypothetical protein